MRQPLRAVMVAWCSTALLSGLEARAADGLGPDGARVAVKVDGSGRITTPAAVDLRLSLAPEDVDVVVWISRSPARTAAGTPARATVGSCLQDELVATAEPGVLACRLRTALLDARAAYHWWIVAGRSDGTAPVVTGPFSFTLTGGGGTASTVTPESAAKLVTRTRFTADRSIKHAPLTTAIARAYRRIRPPRTLAVACWRNQDFTSILASAGTAEHTKELLVEGIWLPFLPRWLHLSGRSCAAVERLVRGASRSGLDAFGLVIALHEAAHAYGIADEARANCTAVQLVPLAARALGIPRRAAELLGERGTSFTRETAPQRYWDARRCRDGGAWDIPGVGTRLGA